MVSSSTSNIDFGGARGSNTGDQFHELWALLQVLDLLGPETDLKAVGVEGVRTERPSPNGDEPAWEGVDCALYHGGTSLETADQIELVQLKYSAANPEKVWSAARLTASTARKGNNSVIRGMVDGFLGARLRMKKGARLKIRLVSNQDLSAGLKKAHAVRWSEPLENAGLDQTTMNELKRLKAATNFAEKEFREFLDTLDFSECGFHSRFSLRAKVVGVVASLLGDDVSSDVRELQVRIRELMLPERAGEIVTEKDVLIWFGLSGRKGLFPCPPDIPPLGNAVERSTADKVVSLLKKGERLVLVHGAGGCGKTTLLRQIETRSPGKSLAVFFDCFGGGRFIYSDDKRHLPENAFLHLANELAVSLRLPLFIPRSRKYPATIQSFMAKLRAGGEALKQLSPDGMLLIIVDAVDNSVAAAEAAEPLERPFVFDLFGADLSALPDNVRIIASCRTARRVWLRLPPNIPEIVCPSFSLQESRQHLAITFSDLSDDHVEQIHTLSNANPRVQAYAVAAANGDRTRLLETLLPGGNSLTDILKATFDNAMKKLGHLRIFQKLISALAFLPAPIAVGAIARITGSAEDIVRDFALDLAPGLLLQGNNITIADEDFVDFIKEKGSINRNGVLSDTAQDFFTTFKTDPYSATHVADALIDAGRARDVLTVIERDPRAAAIGDPTVRRQVQLRRRKLSLAACGDAGSTPDALKIILISAEAERDDSTLNKALQKEMDLTVEFGGSSLRRAILLDPDRVKEHGSFLAQDAARAIRAGDRVTALEQLYFHDAWLRRRQNIDSEELDHWTVTDRDVSARVETILEIAGPKAAFDELMRWAPRDVAIRVAFILAPQLIAAGKTLYIKAFLTECLPPGPWDLILWVSVAMAGEPVDALAIQKSLGCIRRPFIPDPEDFRIAYGEHGWREKLLENFITACELAFILCLDSHAVLDAVNRILKALEGKKRRRLYASNVYRFDGFLRCWLIKEEISRREAKDENFIAYVKTLNSEPKTKKRHGGKRKKRRAEIHQTDNREDERINEKIRALFPVYSARLDILSSAGKNQPITDEQLNQLGGIASHAYDFDNNHDSTYLRDMAAQSVLSLLIVEKIMASELVKHASKLAKGRFNDSFANHRRKLWAIMRLRVSQSDKLVALIAKAAKDIKRQSATLSDKLDAIIHLARLILPISRDDAEALFNDAMNIEREIDLEAFDQIDFISVLAERTLFSAQHDRKKIASDISAFVSGVAKHLSGYDGFPWGAAVHALTCVDQATALAAICCWADDDSNRLDDTLDQFILTALQRGDISLEAATSLVLLIGGSDGDLRKELVSRAATEPEKYKEVIAELARETLLLSPKLSRLSLGREIIDRISPGDLEGPWFKRLGDTVAFLRQDAENKPDKAKEIRPDRMPRRNNNNFQKKFEFDPHGRSFTTPESIAGVLQAAEASGLQYYEPDLLCRMRGAISNPRDRIPFLNALAGMPEDSIRSTVRVEMIHGTLAAWKGAPAVDRWCKETLPTVLIEHFHGANPRPGNGRSVLHQLLNYTGLNTEGRLHLILAGVARVGETLESRTLFAISEEIACTLDAEEAGALLLWYAQHLRSRLPEEDQSFRSTTEIPANNTDAIARFLFALMSDIDTRIRWRAAHVLRRLAKLGCYDIIKAVVSQSSRVKEDAFRTATAPFYFPAARLWLTIALHRISAETPEALALCKTPIFFIATSPELPHAGIREYAKRTLLQLASSGVISLASFEKKEINQVNALLKDPTTKKNSMQPSHGHAREKIRRFDFDDLDTIRYWYEDIPGFFPTVSLDQVLEMAERWILDEWCADPEVAWWDREPRKNRFDDRRYWLWSHRKGSLPTIELYSTHLEWNAMHCVVGELLAHSPNLTNDDFHPSSFEYWLGKVLPTDPPGWLSDNRGPTPLENRLWKEDPRTDSGWVHNIRRDESLTEIGVYKPLRKGWIVVEGCYDTHFPKRDATIEICSALVAHETALALVHELEMTNESLELLIPEEDDDQQNDAPPHWPIGWLSHSKEDIRFDKHDSFRYEVGQIQVRPGLKPTETLGLSRRAGSPPTWICTDTGEAVFLYEAWCDEPLPNGDYYSRNNRSDGWRLWARADMVRSFIANGGWDLICQVEVERRLRNEYGRSYDTYTKMKTHEKIFLLRADGSIADAKGRIGSWTGAGRRAGFRSGRGHA